MKINMKKIEINLKNQKMIIKERKLYKNESTENNIVCEINNLHK